MMRSQVAYGVIAWDATRVWAGTLRGADLDLAVGVLEGSLRDIRGCSAPADGRWAAVTGVDVSSGRQALCRVDLTSGRTDRLLEAEYLLYPAVDRPGELVAYTAPPSRTRGDMSLYLFDIARRRTRLLVGGEVARSCVPSWRTTGQILFHTESREVAEVSVPSGGIRRLFAGEFPAAAPDGRRIASRDGDAILLVGSDDGRPIDISPCARLLRRSYQGGMSWSPDGRLLLVGRTSGTLGYEKDFGTLDVETHRFTRIRQRYLQGVAFY